MKISRSPASTGLAAIIVVLQLASCRTQNLFQPAGARDKTDSTFPYADTGYQYTIRRDDKLTISIWEHDDLSVGSLYGIYNSNEVYGKWLMVDARGEVNVPRIGPLHVKGLTVIQAQDTLRQLFSQWIRTPVVEVKILNKEVTLLGELKTPGKIALDKDDNRLVEMIARAGDFDFYANKRHVQVIRTAGGQTHMITVDLTRMDPLWTSNLRIIPGDVIYVPSKKGKDFDKRLATIMPLISAATGAAIIYKAFF